MSIDWVTVIAQIANFLVLVWLLKRFLYRPILDGIDAREAEIARRMAEAGEAEKKAQTAEAEFHQQKKQLLSDQDALVQQALRESEDQRDSLLAEARAKLEQEQRDWHKHLERERQKFTAQLQRAGEETLLELTRKALRDLADESLEEAIVRQVGVRLHPIAQELSDAAGDSKEAIATTHDALSEPAQALLRADVNKLLPGINLRFETDPEQAHGLVLRVGGAQVAWTVDSYTEEFDALLSERIAAGVSGRVQPGTAKG
ncbi:F0F1 ATP synthase subunit B [Marinobacter salexigens]|uniref:F0F1 ATP synthase subunit B family protein n=1 Tax=Marinobacter salexigens TaxID=1925763 RepID=UPI000C28DFAA|nr:F0F1 ATP synthase subunit B [Marinobacter salexigens]